MTAGSASWASSSPCRFSDSSNASNIFHQRLWRTRGVNPPWETRRADAPRSPWYLLGFGGLAGLLALVPVVLLLELLHAAGGVEELHLAGEERMTGRADVHRDVLAGAAGGELVAARARDGGLLVLGMDAVFHGTTAFLV